MRRMSAQVEAVFKPWQRALILSWTLDFKQATLGPPRSWGTNLLVASWSSAS